ncbi:MAG: hypothetical protein Q9165_001484 [Trypethelium subeluteriae]
MSAGSDDLQTFSTSSNGPLEKRAQNDCPPGNYTTPIGQIFSTNVGAAGCRKDLSYSDFDVTQQANMTDCMDYCSSSQKEVAYGIAFQFFDNPGVCYCKTSNITNAPTIDNVYVHTALTVNVNTSPNDSCPYANTSIQNAADGSPYQILCDQDMILVSDMCPLTSPTHLTATNGLCPTHADSLQDCMTQCSAAHPLCKAVVYAPDMANGYGDCYFKDDVDSSSIQTWNSPGDVRHMAILQQSALNANTSCTNGTTYTSSNGAGFAITCNQNQPPNDLVQFHMQNMSACADACATYTNSSGLTCTGVIFDSSMEDGYQNCYLKSSVGTSFPDNDRHWLQLTRAPSDGMTNSSAGDTTGANATSPAPSTPQTSSSSKAWIAGPVIGGLVGIAAVAGLLYWLRRRRHGTQSAHYSQAPMPPAYPKHASQGWPTDETTYKYGPNHQYMAQSGIGQPVIQQQQYLAEADGERALQELGGDAVHVEMPESNDGGSK